LGGMGEQGAVACPSPVDPGPASQGHSRRCAPHIVVGLRESHWLALVSGPFLLSSVLWAQNCLWGSPGPAGRVENWGGTALGKTASRGNRGSEEISVSDLLQSTPLGSERSGPRIQSSGCTSQYILDAKSFDVFNP
jgi:hypothetical protein